MVKNRSSPHLLDSRFMKYIYHLLSQLTNCIQSEAPSVEGKWSLFVKGVLGSQVYNTLKVN